MRRSDSGRTPAAPNYRGGELRWPRRRLLLLLLLCVLRLSRTVVRVLVYSGDFPRGGGAGITK